MKLFGMLATFRLLYNLTNISNKDGEHEISLESLIFMTNPDKVVFVVAGY